MLTSETKRYRLDPDSMLQNVLIFGLKWHISIDVQKYHPAQSKLSQTNVQFVRKEVHVFNSETQLDISERTHAHMHIHTKMGRTTFVSQIVYFWLRFLEY